MKTIDEFRLYYDNSFTEIAKNVYLQQAKARKAVLVKILINILIILVLVSISVLLSFDKYEWKHLSFIVQSVLISVYIIGVSAIFIFYASIKSVKNKFTAYFKDEVILKIVKFIDEGLSYSPNDYISYEEFNKINLFAKPVNKYFGDDLISGKIDKTFIKFSEIHAHYVTKDKDNKDRVEKIFDGIFVVADFNKNFKGKTYVLPDKNDKTYSNFLIFGEQKKNRFGELVKLEDVEFEKNFAVFSDDQIEARYILSTSLMQRILQFKLKTMKDIRLGFANSNVYIAIPFRQYLFEPRLFGKIVSFENVAAYFEIISLTTNIVDDLNLNTRIWTKE